MTETHDEALFDVFWDTAVRQRWTFSTNDRDTALRASILLCEGGADNVFVGSAALADVPDGLCAEIARSINGKLMEQKANLLLRIRDAQAEATLYRALVEGPAGEAVG